MNVRGSSASEIIIWAGTFFAALILVIFYLNTFFFSAKPFELITKDVDEIVSLINEACEVTEFSARYNPLIEEGTLEFKDNNVCIDSMETKVCNSSFCKIKNNMTIDLKELKYLTLIKKTGETDIYVKQEKV